MRSGTVRGRYSRRQSWLTVAFSCAAVASGLPGADAQPTTRPATETIAAVRQRLAHLRPADRTNSDRALLAAFDFVLAVGTGDGRRIGSVLDPVGYQALPWTGELPERPEKPLLLPAIEKLLPTLPKADHGALPAGCAELVTRAALAAEFPAVATWMLPHDSAVILRPAPDTPAPGWLTHDACIVVRVRGERATVVGGNLLHALLVAAESAAPPAEDK